VLTSQKLDLADGSSGQVTTTGSGVKTDHLQDEAVTMAKLAAALQLILTTGIAPVGSITAFGGITPPTGWYECNGQPVSRFGPGANLFAAISDYWGRGDGVNTFNVPDLRGVALRGVNGASVDAFADPDALARIARPMGAQTSLTGVGNHVGSFQMDDLTSHTHSDSTVSAQGNDRSVVSGGSQTFLPATTTTSAYPTPPAGNETRMKNAYVMYIIKA
jgi:microcystin-dependent protein